MMKAAAVTSLLFFMSAFVGCASINRDNYGAYLKSAEEISKNSKPTFEIKCPPGGCSFLSLAYNDPRDRVAIAQKAPHPVWGFFGTLVKGTVAVFGFKAVSDVAETIAMNSGDKVVYTNSGNAIGGDNSYSPVDISTNISTGDTGYVGDTPTWVGDDQSSVFRDIDMSQTFPEPTP